MQITARMIGAGLITGLVKLIPSPLDGIISCAIGDNWFYFEEDYDRMGMSPEQYQSLYSTDEIAERITIALEEGIRILDIDEYQYYYYYLVENGISPISNEETERLLSNPQASRITSNTKNNLEKEESPRSKYQALLYYGIEENATECSIFCAFKAEDPASPADDDSIANELAAQLDCTPDDDCFQCRSMFIDLPQSLVERIQKDAIDRYLADRRM